MSRLGVRNWIQTNLSNQPVLKLENRAIICIIQSMMTASLVRVTRGRKELEAWQQQLSRVTTAKVKMMTVGKSFRSPIILLSSDCVIRKRWVWTLEFTFKHAKSIKWYLIILIPYWFLQGCAVSNLNEMSDSLSSRASFFIADLRTLTKIRLHSIWIKVRWVARHQCPLKWNKSKSMKWNKSYS